MKYDKQVHDLIIECAEYVAPDEMVGVIVNNGNQFILLDNVAKDPKNNFEVDNDVWLEIQDEWQDDIIIVHSHNENHSKFMSIEDRKLQLNTGLDCVIVYNSKAHNYPFIPKLIGREYENNKMDCYTLFRDCYRLSGYTLPEFKYEYDWFEKGLNLYLDNLPKQGFYQVEIDNIQLGDIIVMNVGGNANHAGIYIGDSVMVHHSINRLSKRDLVDGFWQQSINSIWRHKEWQSLNFTAILDDMAINSI